MILRILYLMLAMTISLSATQESQYDVGNVKKISASTCITSLNNCCRESPSEAELFLHVQSVLNSDILLSPLLQTQLTTQLQQIVTAGGIGVVGPQGPAGPTGATGATGVSGGILDFADFFALMPPDNAATVAVGADVEFPQDGPTSGSGLIARTGPSTFDLTDIGVYEVSFQVSVSEAGQLILTLNGADLAYTVVGRATGTSQIVGMAIVQTTTTNSILTVRNPAGNSTALTITPLAGGTRSVSAQLIITRIQ